jgi:hypothetical protein
MKKALLIITLGLAGCEPMATTTPGQPSNDACNASAWSRLVGQPAATAQAAPDPKRVYRQGDPVTMDFNDRRLNFETNDAGTIIKVTCG